MGVVRSEPTVLTKGGEMNGYAPLVGMIILGAVFVLATIAVNVLLAVKRPNRAKHEIYECGIEPTPQPAGGGKFPVKFFVVAMLYIVFDIDIMFLYPWAVDFNHLGVFALVEMVLFVAMVFIPYLYIRRRGGLDWT
ncbi:NADH dehydrogenase subunit A [Cutibacterium avidum]|uniref:NADH-quinone oxidoreductase subunit A n=2 Tax=Cutibacterium avidum TaxID=33010 RepID=G4CVK3_9ACTN|nr:NADH-quinone oxidoreductase subunit A [Cutibacterium avidum ATCC 25577]KXA65864.1 NADH dehydrogenase subunit A [Cutibacterium avidum]